MGDPLQHQVTALHEAAHGVVAVILGFRLKLLTIVPDKAAGNLGTAFYKTVGGDARVCFITDIVVALAGHVFSEPPPGVQWPPDFTSARGTEREHLNRHIREATDRFKVEVVEELYDMAVKMVLEMSRDHEVLRAIKFLADTLLLELILTGDEAHRVIDGLLPLDMRRLPPPDDTPETEGAGS